MTRADNPVGYFVHHQGRGHAERAASIANLLIEKRAVTIFSARSDIFPALDPRIDLIVLPSLFEQAEGHEPNAMGAHETPDTMHCAPLGWESISSAIATITGWFDAAKPSLFITDVSAELGQLARIASVPHIAVLQHGERDDPGHLASYQAAVGLLAPYAVSLEQSDRPAWMKEKTHYAGGIGIDPSVLCAKEVARARLGIAAEIDLVVVIGGGGGSGLPSAPLTLGARDEPRSTWVTLGKMQSEWHETTPENLTHLGWVENAHDWISAADRVVSSCGNTTAHLVACAARPWVVVPEWRYFAEQACKAEALDQAGVAAVASAWPASVQKWRRLWAAAKCLDPETQKKLIDPGAAKHTAEWIDGTINQIWSAPVNAIQKVRAA